MTHIGKEVLNAYGFHSYMTLISNKKATFNYEILETNEAGIELFGYEVKSIRASKGNLEGSYIIVRGGEAYLIGALISPFQQNNIPENYDERRNRRLILHKEEIKKLSEVGKGTGKSAIPLSLYAKKNKIKLEIAIVKGKKKFDKRETIKKRDMNRDIERELKR